MRHRQRHNARINKALSISEVGGIRYLHLGSEHIQSAMNVRQPSELVLAYTQTMMAWLLLRDDAVKITQIGLGGGSLVRWIWTHLPNAKQTVVELNPYVVAMAKMHFKLPDVRIVVGDGIEFIKENPESCEVLLLDAYGADGLDEVFLREDFFYAAKAMLLDNGVFVANWWSGDKRFVAAYERLTEVFDGRVVHLNTQDQSNVIVMAFKNLPEFRTFDAMKKRIPRLEERFNLPFMGYFAKLRAQNPHDDTGLVLD